MLTPETILQGRYRIIRQLGQGGMGAVYEAIDQRLDTTVALKETFFADERLRKQFEREARLLARLHHPALPRVSDHFSEGDGQFLVMQFIPGDDLSEMIARKRGPFPPHQVLLWADQLLDALDYLHTQDPQIVHRDIKPQNLKLTSRGQIILLDFGLAKGQAGEISRVTTAASIFGYTPNYAPLEQIQGLGTDSRSDLYSLGATVYHLLTGIKPPDALTRAAALVNGQPDPLQPANEANSPVAPEVDEVLQRAMAQNREQRYPTAADMRNALHGTDQAETVSNRGEAQTVLLPTARTVAATTRLEARQKTVSAGETTVVRPGNVGSGRRLLPWALSAAAVVALACGVFAFYSFRSHGDAVVQVSPSPTPVVEAPVPSPSESATADPDEKKTDNSQTDANQQPTPKKTEKPVKSEEKRKTTITPFPTPPSTSVEGHRQTPNYNPDVPPDPEIDMPNRPTRPTPNVRVAPNGVMIRNFPDGSQLITMPDGMRVFVDSKGRRQILRPVQKPRRRAQTMP